jgi:hypothetical protein
MRNVRWGSDGGRCSWSGVRARKILKLFHVLRKMIRPICL